MKTLTSFLFISFASYCFAQLQPPEAYISFSGFYEDEFEPSAYLNFSVGTELFALKHVAPEVDITYYFGGRSDEDWDVGPSGEIDFRSFLDRFFDAWVWGAGPKLFIQDDYNRLVFIPKYHFGNQRAIGDYFDSNEIDERQEVKSKFNFWTFSLGYEFLGVDKIGKLGLYLTYTAFNAGKSLNQLDFSELGYHKQNFNTKAIGVTVRLSTGFGKRKEVKQS
ncbi:hypothetical protein [Flagellimonas flava]|uniref:Outer membrane protein beta-barrel domain-containing protein n=1 Tax=Flagellimonas flava TaxID=570519 RepID=A0A1M5MJ40_9FLAO|nr:hypothetical protein [Allomuricauda flava]SHG77231.1 hypothetical protein SAMN04488116_2474 [Allomuricauda flava]